MVFQEPMVDFVNIMEKNVISTSGPSYEVCEKVQGITVCDTIFCGLMQVAYMTWENACGPYNGYEPGEEGYDPTLDGHVVV